MIKKNFLWAINRLKARNQRFVDKNGVTSWSKESDRIIEALAEYFNNREKNEATDLLIKKLGFILELYGVPYKQIFHLPVEFLEYESNKLKINGGIPEQPRIQLVQILSHYICHQVIIESLIQAVISYPEINNQAIRENLIKNRPQLAEYFLDPEKGNVIENIQNDYYAGNLKA